MDLDTFRDHAPAFYNARVALELISGPGVGKTSIIRAVAGDMSVKLGQPFGLNIQILSGIDPADAKGIMMPVTEGGHTISRFTRSGILPTRWNTVVYEGGEPREMHPDEELPVHGLMFLDEFGQCTADVQKPCGQLLLEGGLGEHRLPDNWRVWAASNRMSDRAGVAKTLSHMQNRRMQLMIQPNYTAWELWAIRHGVHPLTVAFAHAHAGDVFQESVPSTEGPYATPRALVLCSEVLSSMNGGKTDSLPDSTVALEVMTGWLGEGVAIKFMSHIRMGNALPSVEKIMAHPDTTEVPGRVDAQFALVCSLAVHADSKAKAKPIFEYVRRLELELQSKFVHQVTAGPNLMHLSSDPAFVQWLQKNSALVLDSRVGMRR